MRSGLLSTFDVILMQYFGREMRPSRHARAISTSPGPNASAPNGILLRVAHAGRGGGSVCGAASSNPSLDKTGGEYPAGLITSACALSELDDIDAGISSVRPSTLSALLPLKSTSTNSIGGSGSAPEETGEPKRP
jgi:hypothetical protein